MSADTPRRPDEALRQLDALRGESTPSQKQAAGEWLERWIEDSSRLHRKRDLDFATVVEVASQIGGKSLDLGKIESYSMTMLMGQFGILKAFFMRQRDFSDSAISVVGKSPKLPSFSFALESPLGTFLRERAEPVPLDDLVGEFPESEALREGGVELVVPLVKGMGASSEDLKGCICVGKRLGGAFSEADLELLRLLGSLIAISVHNAQLYHRSIIDGLTRVYSRGHFDIHLFQELSRAGRELRSDQRRGQDKPVYVSLVMLDIDHFKSVNDTLGHLVGDQVLRSVARYLKGSVRKLDVVARYGGEEFALVLPETSKQAALTLTERLRIGLAKLTICETGAERPEPLQITASFGVATFPDDALDMRELIAQADKALFEAKDAGRNRVVGATLRDPNLPESAGEDDGS